ncbi:porin family protein, partial [Streptococcus dysgalactiae]
VGVLTPAFAGFAYSNSTHLTANIARVGVNYRFGGPVVARY